MALSAGHRPCGECRNADYRRFRSLWETCYGSPVSADIMDARLHADRRNGPMKRTYRAELATLPDGTYVTLDREAWLIWENALFAWSDSGYTRRRPHAGQREVEVLTPRFARIDRDFEPINVPPAQLYFAHR